MQRIAYQAKTFAVLCFCFPGKCICIRNRRNGCVAFLLRKQAQDIKRSYWERFEPDYLTDEQKLANIEAYLQIEKDLGIKRGRPMSHEQANKMHGNPHYGESKAYSVNCQTCVVAYELRLRGFDVSALPNTAGSTLSKLSKATHTAWQNITREDIPVIARTTLDRYGHIKQPPLKWAKVSAAMTETGRYHIAWRWKRKRSGHIITAERLPDGSLRFYDPQNGMSGALDLYKKDIAGNVRIYRIDNLAPNANIVKDVLTKGEAKAAAGTAAQGGINALPKAKQTSLRKDVAQWSKSNLPEEILPDGTAGKRAYINLSNLRIVVNRDFFMEVFAKNKNRNNLKEILELAKQYNTWMPKAKFIRQEAGKHHAFSFNVYEAEINGLTIEIKTKNTSEEILYNIRIKKED